MYMKPCSSPNCTNKVKNSYTYCYDCNIKNKDESSSISSVSEAIYKKESIPKTLRNCLWINFFDDKIWIDENNINCFSFGHKLISK